MIVRAPRASWILDSPEFNVAVFAFLLNLGWEFWQVPLFREMPERPHWEGVQVCTRATLGDAGIALVSFWVASIVARSRSWVLYPRRSVLMVFIAAGVSITVAFEWLATRTPGRWGWSYSDEMPMIFGIGLLPILQWLIIPPLVVWFVRRQLT